MCELLPTTLEQLQAINGMGKVRVQKYGSEIIEVIKNYYKEKIKVIRSYYFIPCKNDPSCFIQIINDDEQYIIWCFLEDESKLIKKELDCIEVKGKDSTEYKAQAFEDFQDKKIKLLVTKPKIGGFGLNFQNANNKG